ncbi:alkyl hydroperoxide reductase [Siphonobacter sp. BAB-5405]|uniref:TlpA disulfide reductase family protein n=1 Tax=Siphonobacter sp. BAB-5405 TaxID=1864825 RepID=UPI000C7F79D7|nr:TlpA disulfide reductase family protein [Siphonobacter sp. BAB-5405]PMD93228.1 alkyl hydroperoxide reductase [Siphonobacter sp. BAB-5405]
MKLIFSTILFLGTLTGFAQQDTYHIQGQVRNPNVNEKAYLQIVNDRGLPVSIDSSVITSQGFEMKGKVLDGGGFYRLLLGGSKPVILLLEGGENLQVEADVKAPQATKVTGSKNMAYYDQLNAMAAAFKNQVDRLNLSYEQATQKKDKAAQQKIQQQFEQGQTDMVTKVKALLPEMGSSLAALYATNFLNQEQDFEVFEQLADRFEKEKPNVKIYKAFIATVRRVQTSRKGLSIGSPAPEINLPDPQQKIVSLSSLRGKYVLIDFWAGWCGPCRRENPNVVRLYNQYKDKGFTVYGVSLDSDRKLWTDAIQKDGLTWTQVSDLKYFDSAAAIDYGIQHIPFTVLIDPQGKVIAKELRGEALEAKLKELMP